MTQVNLQSGPPVERGAAARRRAGIAPPRRSARRAAGSGLAVAAMLVLATACSPVRFEVGGQTDDGEPFTGYGIASFSGDGEIVISRRDVECRGTYDTYDLSEHLDVPITCSNGVTGMAKVDRNPNDNLMSGQGSIRLSDGTSAVFWYGPER